MGPLAPSNCMHLGRTGLGGPRMEEELQLNPETPTGKCPKPAPQDRPSQHGPRQPCAQRPASLSDGEGLGGACCLCPSLLGDWRNAPLAAPPVSAPLPGPQLSLQNQTHRHTLARKDRTVANDFVY